MRLYEKILIGFGLLILGIQLLPSFNGKTISFIFANWFIALSYLIGGYWLLNLKENKKYLIPIMAGIVFATSLVVFPMLIKVKIELLYKKIPLINGCFFIGLGIYLFINRNTKEIIQAYKGIFIRSTIILAVVSFFAYTPSTFTPYSHILWALNKGNHQLEHNKKMFEYYQKFEEAFKNGDCESAIIYAEESNEAGQKWLNIYRGTINQASTMEEAIKLSFFDIKCGHLNILIKYCNEMEVFSEIFCVTTHLMSKNQKNKTQVDGLIPRTHPFQSILSSRKRP